MLLFNMPIEKHLLIDMKSLGLSLVNSTYPTNFSNTCDTLLHVFFVNDLSKIKPFDQISLLAFSKHDAIFLTYETFLDQNDYSFK